MNRRGFLGLLAGVIASKPLAARLLEPSPIPFDWGRMTLDGDHQSDDVAFSLQRMADDALQMIESHISDSSRADLPYMSLGEERQVAARLGWTIRERVPQRFNADAEFSTMMTEHLRNFTFTDVVSCDIELERNDLRFSHPEFRDRIMAPWAYVMAQRIKDESRGNRFALMGMELPRYGPEDISGVTAKGYGMSLRMMMCPERIWSMGAPFYTGRTLMRVDQMIAVAK